MPSYTPAPKSVHDLIDHELHHLVGEPDPDPMDRQAIELRWRIGRVRQAKLANVAAGGLGELALADLDRILPPIPCARTRERQRRAAHVCQ